jgi:N-acyl-D-amino-acid deacylase
MFPRAFIVLLTIAFAAFAQPTDKVDLLLRGGRIVDGTGAPWVLADVAITGDRIVALGRNLSVNAARTLDARGLVVAPGFIDLHTHARRNLLNVPTAENYVRQGVTTIFEGPDGSSPLPLGEWLDLVGAKGVSPNVASFVGHGTIRERVIGLVDRPATADELDRMRALVSQGMLDGAFGLSTGLFYVPGTFASTDEIVELAKVAGAMGGIHISHMRNEAAAVAEGVRETIAIGERAGLPTGVTHHKIIGRPNWGRSVETLALVDAARARGVDVTIDMYPYTASSTGLQALLPAWAQEGGTAAINQRLRDPATRKRILAAVVENLKVDRGGGDPKNVQIASCRFDPSLAGKTLADLTRAAGRPVDFETAAETALDVVEKGGAQAIFHAISEEDLVRILRHPTTTIASDGEIPTFGQAAPHPRAYGTFPRVLGQYVRDQGVISLEQAVMKMTGQPAARAGLTDRGVIRPGMKADLAIFDPAAVTDHATFEQPHQYASGVSLVVVNGVIVFENGRMTAARPGRVLRGPSHGQVRSRSAGLPPPRKASADRRSLGGGG